MDLETEILEMEDHFNADRQKDTIGAAARIVEFLFRAGLLERLKRSDRNERLEWIEQEKRIGNGRGIERFGLVELAAMNSKVNGFAILAESRSLVWKAKLNIDKFADIRNHVSHGKSGDFILDKDYYLEIRGWIENAGEILGLLSSRNDLLKETAKNVYELYPLIKKWVRHYARQGERVVIKNLALDMQTTFNEIWHLMVDNELRQVEYYGLVIDPEAPEIQAHCKVGVSPQAAEASIAAFKRLAAEYAEQFKANQIKIEIRKYSHLPLLHGVAINDRHAFWSLTEMNRFGIKGGPDPYNTAHAKLPVSTDQPSGLRSFRSWFDHYWAHAVPIDA